MTLPTRAPSSIPRGQALVEVAIVLPLLVLLVVMAIDFGRVFFGWVGLHNAARIGADFAAQHPDADWASESDAQRQKYIDRMAADAAAINCELPEPLPMPSFPEGDDVGDDAVVELECAFGLITPIMSDLVGSPLDIRAQAIFPIRKGFAQVPPNGEDEGENEPPPCALVPDMVSGTVSEARTAWRGRGFTGAFTPATGFDDDTVTAQFTTPTSSPESDCIPLTSSVVVESETAEGCPSGEFRVPLLSGQTVGDARDDWDASAFTGDFSPNGRSNEWAVGQEPASGECRPPSATMTVTVGPAPEPKQCTAPDFVGKSTTEAPALWSDEEFTGSIDYKNRPPYTVGRQSLVAGQKYDCTASVSLWR